MVYINLRVNVADYDKWRLGFDTNESNRNSAGSTGVNQFYRVAAVQRKTYPFHPYKSVHSRILNG